MSKVETALYEARKNGEKVSEVIVTFATLEVAEGFRDPRFESKKTSQMGDECFASGVLQLEALEDLEEDDRVLTVQPNVEVHTMPVGGPIEF